MYRNMAKNGDAIADATREKKPIGRKLKPLSPRTVTKNLITCTFVMTRITSTTVVRFTAEYSASFVPAVHDERNYRCEKSTYDGGLCRLSIIRITILIGIQFVLWIIRLAQIFVSFIVRLIMTSRDWFIGYIVRQTWTDTSSRHVREGNDARLYFSPVRWVRWRVDVIRFRIFPWRTKIKQKVALRIVRQKYFVQRPTYFQYSPASLYSL